MKLKSCVREFFDQYLPHLKNVSPNTVRSYRDTFMLFLPFVATHLSVPIKKIELQQITPQVIAAFLHHLHEQRNNSARTINSRLATLKSLAKMIRLLYPEFDDTAKMILRIPQRRYQKRLVGYLSHEEILNVFESVDLKQKDGFRDYCLLHLLFDSGARAAEVAALTLTSCDPKKRSLAIIGKGNRYRVIELKLKTVDLIELYIKKYRRKSKPAYRHILFINQRGEAFTRYGINALGRKYLRKVLSPKQLNNLSPAHSFRHSCAVNMLLEGEQPTTIKNRLGHENLKSTMVYLKLNLSARREAQKRFIEHTRSRLNLDPKINALLDWEHKEEVLSWLDSL